MRKTQLPRIENLPNISSIKSEVELSEYQLALLEWYDLNQRDLPWRQNSSLYKTVVSEFMLQQTRVITVLPYFKTWLKRFPDFDHLANASETEVLKAWEGLGYYSRARNLHKLAKIAKYWKEPPRSLNEWKALPGVGPYIAAAVTSISMNQPEAVCDGNVVRVLSRVFEISQNFKDGSMAQKKIQPLAQLLISPHRPGDYNQAIMELGATVCHRSSPLCVNCPIHKKCKAGQTGKWMNYPSFISKIKKHRKIRRYWVEKENKLLLEVSKSKRLMGIFELPRELPSASVNSAITSTIIATRKRTIGNVNYTEEIYKVNLSSNVEVHLAEGCKWIEWKKMKDLTLSGPHRKWINELKNTGHI